MPRSIRKQRKNILQQKRVSSLKFPLHITFGNNQDHGSHQHESRQHCPPKAGAPARNNIFFLTSVCIMAASLCKLHLAAATHSYTCTLGSTDTVQLALVVVVFFPQLMHIVYLHPWWSSPTITHAGGAFPSMYWCKYSTFLIAGCCQSATIECHINICFPWHIYSVNWCCTITNK